MWARAKAHVMPGMLGLSGDRGTGIITKAGIMKWRKNGGRFSDPGLD